MKKKLGIFTVVACGVLLLNMNTVKADLYLEQPELQTWHTSGMKQGIIKGVVSSESVAEAIQSESTLEVVPSVTEAESEYVAPSVTEEIPEYVAPSVTEEIPEYVAPSVTEEIPEYVAPPVAEATPEYVAPSAPVDPSVNEGSGWTPPTAEELDDYLSGVDWDNPLWCYDYETGNDYYCVYE